MSPGTLRTPPSPRVVYATALEPSAVEQWLDPEAIGVTAHQFQRYIGDKDADLRITAVGQRLFPVAIRAATPAARVDWRADYSSLDYELAEVPEEVAAGLRGYLKAAEGLRRVRPGAHHRWRALLPRGQRQRRMGVAYRCRRGPHCGGAGRTAHG